MGRPVTEGAWGLRRVLSEVKTLADVPRRIDELQIAIAEALANAQRSVFAATRGTIHRRLQPGVYDVVHGGTYLLLGTVTLRLPQPFDGMEITILPVSGTSQSATLAPGSFLLNDSNSPVTLTVSEATTIKATCGSWRVDVPVVPAYDSGFYYGDQSDGDYAVPGATTVVLTRDMHYKTLSFANATTSKIDTRGFWIYCETLDLSNVRTGGGVFCTGVDGSNATTSTAGAGGTGTNFRSSNGANGGAGVSDTYEMTGLDGESSVGFGGKGGNGGEASGGEGLAGRGGNAGPYPYGNIQLALSVPTLAGGGGGAGETTDDAGHNAGGGGQGAPGIRICAKSIILPTGTAVGIIKTTGGNGGSSYDAANSGNAGGGGGGGILMVCDTITGTCSDFARSIGGGGSTAGSSAVDGNGGYGGVVALYVATTGQHITNGPTANSGATGGGTGFSV